MHDRQNAPFHHWRTYVCTATPMYKTRAIGSAAEFAVYPGDPKKTKKQKKTGRQRTSYAPF